MPKSADRLAKNRDAYTVNADRESVDGFLLTRHWRDNHRSRNTISSDSTATNNNRDQTIPGSVELSYWATTSRGPLRIRVPDEAAVCFIERDRVLEISDDRSFKRKPVDLKLMDGGPVDALYFNHQRDLSDIHRQTLPIHESDIKPSDRYLMERFINAGFRATGQIIEREGFLEMLNPHMSSHTEKPNIKPVSIDIEIRANSRELYSVGACTRDRHVVFMVDTAVGTSATTTRELQVDHREKPIEYMFIRLPDAKAVVNHFFSWLKQEDPDIIIGWSIVNFDLAFLHQFCEDHKIPFAIARGNEQATILQPSRITGGSTVPRIARIPGRPVLDGIDLLRAGFWAFESFSLDNVAHELLGTRKLISSDSDKVAEINRQFEKDKPQLADYNLLDCVLVLDIFDKADLWQFAIQRAAITGLAIDRMGGSVAAFDHLYLPRLHRAGFVAHNVAGRSNQDSSPGGYVMDSIPGLYDNVLVLDFKSLYPSIIRTFCIDPLGLAIFNRRQKAGNEEENLEHNKLLKEFIPGFNDAWFSRDQHILPDLIESLWQQRDHAKSANDRALSQAIKIIMNSFYGVLGSSGCRFHKQQLASSITRRGHQIITQTRDFIETKGYRVIYGDTDSVFVLLGPDIGEQQAQKIGKQLTQELNSWWQDSLLAEYSIDSALEVEFETHFLKFLMPTVRGQQTGSKKRYAGMINQNSPDDDASDKNYALVFKGLEAVRTDWTPLARNFQRELYRRVFLNEPFEDFIRDTAQALVRGELDQDLIYRKRLRRKLNDYQKNVPPHVQAARKLPVTGQSNRSWISYVITHSGPEPADYLQSPPDYDHYLERQLAPAADGILHFLETSFSAINDSQMQMF